MPWLAKSQFLKSYHETFLRFKLACTGYIQSAQIWRNFLPVLYQLSKTDVILKMVILHLLEFYHQITLFIYFIEIINALQRGVSRKWPTKLHFLNHNWLTVRRKKVLFPVSYTCKFFPTIESKSPSNRNALFKIKLAHSAAQ